MRLAQLVFYGGLAALVPYLALGLYLFRPSQ